MPSTFAPASSSGFSQPAYKPGQASPVPAAGQGTPYGSSFAAYAPKPAQQPAPKPAVPRPQTKVSSQNFFNPNTMVTGWGFDPNAARASREASMRHHNDPEVLWRHMASAYAPNEAMNEWVKAKESGNVSQGLTDAVALNFKNNAEIRGDRSNAAYFSHLMDGDNWEKQSPADKDYAMRLIRPPRYNDSPWARQQSAAFAARITGPGQQYSG